MTTNTVPQRQSKKNTFAPLIMDVAVPVGSYYLFKDGLGTSTLMALGLSSVVSAVRVAWSIVRERKFNHFASLILFVNVVGLALSFVSGDPRLMLAKDSGVSSAIGIGVLVSVVLGKPMMTAGMKPWLVRGDAEKEAAWERLRNGSPAFRRAERVFSVVWGVVLLGECVVRIVGAYTLPVDTMVWLGTVIFIVAMVLGFLVSGALAAGPMAGMLAAEVKADDRTFAPEAATGEPRVAAPAPALAR
ncbi:VC0807 family protein [Streptomyces sp. NPDC002573]|uniref:VC0807 family protein n=1 Tax=Streptomyces sp. NPDC002573 TaxID=3364651 RepID=UPI0036C97609